MKQNLLILLTGLCLSIGLQGQTSFRVLDHDNGGAVVNNGASFSHNVGATRTFSHELIVENTSASTVTVNLRRFDDLLNSVGPGDNAEAFFCVGPSIGSSGGCLPPTVSSAVMAIAAGGTVSLSVDLTEASVEGKSTVRYRLVNAAVASESVSITFNYNEFVGINEISRQIATISDIYPNPNSQNRAFIDIASKSETSVQVQLVGLLGNTISRKTEVLNEGKNKISVDLSGLSSGVYFVTLSDKKGSITTKRVIVD